MNVTGRTKLDMDALFIVPAFHPRLEEESLGTLILSNIARSQGFNVDILRYWEIDNELKSYSTFCKSFLAIIKSKSPRIICFYCRCSEYHICIDLAKRTKCFDSNIVVTFGGPQADIVAEETLQSFPFIDYICRGEGEQTIVPFIRCLLHRNSSDSLDSIPGLTYRDGKGNIILNPLPTFLPYNYSYGQSFYDYIPERVIKNSRRVLIDVGRGCPFSCTFCSSKSFWKGIFRLRDISDILCEIDYVQRKYQINTFAFDHDLFTADKDKVLEFCESLSKRTNPISWDCSSRIDTLDKQMIDVMADNGTRKILFGIESGSPDRQKMIHKNLNLEKCRDVIIYCIAKGIKPVTTFMYGFPEETYEELEKTITMMRDFQALGCDVVLNACAFVPGTTI